MRNRTVGILFVVIIVTAIFAVVAPTTVAKFNPPPPEEYPNSTIRIYGAAENLAPVKYDDWMQLFDPTIIPSDSITFNPTILECNSDYPMSALSSDIDLMIYLRSWYEPCHEYSGDLGTQKYPTINVEHTYMIIDSENKMPFHGGADNTYLAFPIVEIASQTGLGAFENEQGVADMPNLVGLTCVDGVVTPYGETTEGTIRIEKKYTLAPGEVAQFLDHKLRYDSTDGGGNTAYSHLWYAGNMEDDAAEMIELSKGQTVFFDRWNNMLTSPSHPDATWYARFDVKTQNDTAEIVVGKELNSGDTFYVDGVRYDVPSIGVLDINGDTKADVFKFITLRTPLPKGSSSVNDETVVTSQWLDCILWQEVIPILPPFNMNHSIVDNIDVPLWAPLRHLDEWPEGDVNGSLGIEYFPSAEAYLTMQYPTATWLQYFRAVPIGAEPTTDSEQWENSGGPFYPGNGLPPYWVMDVCGKVLPAPTEYTVFETRNWIAMDVSKRIISDVEPLAMYYVSETIERRLSTDLLEKLNETGIGSPEGIYENWTKFDIQTLPDQYTELAVPAIPDLNVSSYVTQEGNFYQMLYGDYLITTSLITPNTSGGDFPDDRVAFSYDRVDGMDGIDLYVNADAKDTTKNVTVRIYGDVNTTTAPSTYANWKEPFNPTAIVTDSITFDPAIMVWSPNVFPMFAQSKSIDLKTYLRAWYEPCYAFNNVKEPAVVTETTYMIIDSENKMPFHGDVSNTRFAFPIAENESTGQIGLELFENTEGTPARPNLVKLTLIEGATEPYGKTVGGKIRLEKRYMLAPGEEVQFLDHKLELVSMKGANAAVDISYAGNNADDSTTSINLDQNEVLFFDRYISASTTPHHPDQTWYACFNGSLESGHADITVGKELQWDDVFYVDGVRYEVVAIEVVDDTGDGEADKFTYITLRMPFAKDLTNSPFRTREIDDSGEPASSQWITMIPACHQIPVLPPFNMVHGIVDDTDVVLWTSLKCLEYWPYGDPDGVPGIEYFPCAERYLTQQYPPYPWLKYFYAVPIDTDRDMQPLMPTDWELWESYGGPFYPSTELPQNWTLCRYGIKMERPETWTVFDNEHWIANDVNERVIGPIEPLEFCWKNETKEPRSSTNLLQRPIGEGWTKYDIQTLPDLYTEFKLPVLPSLKPLAYVGGHIMDYFKPDMREYPGSYLITTSFWAPNAEGDFNPNQTYQQGNRYVFTFNASDGRGIYLEEDPPADGSVENESNNRIVLTLDSKVSEPPGQPMQTSEIVYSTIKLYGEVENLAPARYDEWMQSFDPTVIPSDSITFNPTILECNSDYPMSALSSDIDLMTYIRSWYEPCHKYSGDLGTQKYPTINVEHTYMIIDSENKMPFHGGADNTYLAFPIVEDETTEQIGLELFENIQGTPVNPNLVKLTLVEGATDTYGETTEGTMRIEKKYSLASGEVVQFLDHKLRYDSTDVAEDTAYCHLWYAGNLEDDAAEAVELSKGQTVFFDRWNNILTSPSHPDATWYARFEFKTQNDTAEIVVGKELSSGDTFYVDGVRYDVPSIEVLDTNGNSEADVFKFITLRTPLPKGSSSVNDETVVTSQWLDCIEMGEKIPVLPPSNLNHSIVDNINVPLWAPLKHLDLWPYGDVMGVPGMEYFPGAEAYVTMQYPPEQWLLFFRAVPIGVPGLPTDWETWLNEGGPFYPGDNLPPYWVMNMRGKVLPAPDEYTIFDSKHWVAMDVSKRVISDVESLVMYYVSETVEQRLSTDLLEILNETGIGTPALKENWTKFDIQTLPDQYTEFVFPEIPDLDIATYAGQQTFRQMLYGDYLITTSLIAPNSRNDRPVRGGNFQDARVAFCYDVTEGVNDPYVNTWEDTTGVRIYGDVQPYGMNKPLYTDWSEPFNPTAIVTDSITFDPAILEHDPVEYPMSTQSKNIDLKTELRAGYEPCYAFNKNKKSAIVAETTYMIVDSETKMPFHGGADNTYFAFPIVEDETTEQVGLELFENIQGTPVSPNLAKLKLVEGTTDTYGKTTNGTIRIEKKYSLAPGEVVQFLDHELQYISTSVTGDSTYCRLWYAGNEADDSAIVVSLNQNKMMFFDRFMGESTTPHHPGQTWYARFEGIPQSGHVDITIGKELQWGDVFYVDSVRYEVVAIEVIDDTGDGEADEFTYITLRTPFAKGWGTFYDSGEPASSQWITGLQLCDPIPVLPPFNMEHEIVDDTDVVLWQPLTNFEEWPIGDPNGVPCMEYFPCAERYLTMQYPPYPWLKYFRAVPIGVLGLPIDWQLWKSYGGPFYPGTELPDNWTCCSSGDVMEAPENYTVFNTTGWIAHDVTQRIVSSVSSLEFCYVSESKEMRYSTNLLQVLNETVTGEEPVEEDWTKYEIQTLPARYTEFKLPTIPSIKPDTREYPGSYLITASFLAPNAEGDLNRNQSYDETNRFAFAFNASHGAGLYVGVYIPPNLPPIADAGRYYYGDTNETIQFNGSGTDPDGDAIIEYAWDFDNDWIPDSDLQNPTYVWTTNGTYYPTLKVKDERGAWSGWDWCRVKVDDPIVQLGPYSLSSCDKYYVHIFNIDDIGRAYVNGESVAETGFGEGGSGAIDITSNLTLGENTINLTVENLREGYAYGFEIKHYDSLIGKSDTLWAPDPCGIAGVEGCNNDSQQTGIVYNRTIILELEEREFDDFTFVQLTDVHIGYDQLSILKDLENMKQRVRNFAIALEEINNLDPKPDFILHTGDLVEWNNENFFMAFKGILELCDMPSYYIPGNHDRRTGALLPGDDALANYHKYIKTPGPNIDEDDFLIAPDNYTFDYEGYHFIGLDSGKDLHAWDLCPEGSGLSPEQIRALFSDSNKNRGPKIVFMHHPAINDDKTWFTPYDYAPGGNAQCIGNNRNAFITYCTLPFTNVQLVLTGHTHKHKVFKVFWGDIAVGTTVKDEHRPLFIQTRSATKDEPGGNGFGYIKVEKNKATYDSKVITSQPKRVISTERKVIPEGWVPKLRWCTPHAYDSQGRHTGLNDAGYVERNIPQSYHTGIYEGKIGSKDTPHMIVLFADDNYHVEWKPLPATIQEQQNIQEMEEEEFFNVISVRTYDNDSFTDYYYYNFSITQNGTASITLNQTAINYTLVIDTDGDGAVDETKDPDSIETNYAPNASIIAPENNSIFVHGDEITFNGTGTDPEDGILNTSSLVWTSDINGLIGTGNEFNTSNLSAGTHTITLMVNDSADLIDTDSVEILINAPDLTLNSSDIIFSNPNPAAGEIITINATIRNIGLINATNVTVLFFDGIPEFEISNVTINVIRAGENETVNVTWNTLGKMGKHSIPVMIDPDDATEEMNETNNRASKSILVNEEQTQITFFDTDKGTYPSIMGTHNGTITPSCNISVSKLYTYPCSGTGGHTEYAKIWNLSWAGAEAHWNGYVGDWHNITFNETFVLYENKTYNYTIRTGSYPQIIHESPFNATGGTITCDKFIDANGRIYYDWIPAIGLW